MKNLEIAFPDFSLKQRLEIRNKFYKYFFDMLAENIKDFDENWRAHSTHISIENKEIFEELYKKNKKVVIMLGHHGNFEWLSVIPNFIPQNIYVVYNEIKNKSFEKLIIKKRTKYNLKLFPMKDTYNFIESNNDPTAAYGFISDQSPHEGRIHHRSKFFAENTPTHVGAEKIAKIYDMAVVYLECRRQKKGKYIYSAHLITENPRDYENYKISDLYNQLLEASIRKQPELYLWTHKRWKHLQPGIYQ